MIGRPTDLGTWCDVSHWKGGHMRFHLDTSRWNRLAMAVSGFTMRSQDISDRIVSFIRYCALPCFDICPFPTFPVCWCLCLFAVTCHILISFVVVLAEIRVLVPVVVAEVLVAVATGCTFLGPSEDPQGYSARNDWANGPNSVFVFVMRSFKETGWA